MKINKFFYVNMDSQTDRKTFMENEILKSDVLKNNIERFSAVDGSKIDLNNIPHPITKESLLE